MQQKKSRHYMTKTKILLLLSVVVLAAFLSACQKSEPQVQLQTYVEPDVKISDLPEETTPAPEYFDVIFHENGHGTVPIPQSVMQDTPARDPGALTEDGYTFTGWYLDEDCSEGYDFTTPVTKDLALYAGWDRNPVYYTASFMDDTLHMAPEAQTILEGELISQPEDLSAEEYIFHGWFADAECTQAYDFTQPVWEDKTIYAGWEKLPDPLTVQVIFDANGADQSSFKVQSFTQRVEGQQFVGEISRTGSEMLGWARSKTAELPEEETNKVVTDDWIQSVSENEGSSIILYAVWYGPKYTALTPGDVNDDIKKMQQALTDLGFYEGAVDGSYGPGTAKSVGAFRVANGLSEDGTADTDMLTILYEQAPQP